MSGEGVHNPAAIDTLALEASVQALQADIDLLQLDVDAIREVTDSEAILTETSGQITTDGTEQTVYTNEAPAGIFEAKLFSLDFTNQTVTETLRVRVYRRIVPGGVMLKFGDTTFNAVQDPLGKDVTLPPNRYGIRVTIQSTGTKRAYNWEVFYKEAP